MTGRCECGCEVVPGAEWGERGLERSKMGAALKRLLAPLNVTEHCESTCYTFVHLSKHWRWGLLQGTAQHSTACKVT